MCCVSFGTIGDLSVCFGGFGGKRTSRELDLSLSGMGSGPDQMDLGTGQREDSGSSEMQDTRTLNVSLIFVNKM